MERFSRDSTQSLWVAAALQPQLRPANLVMAALQPRNRQGIGGQRLSANSQRCLRGFGVAQRFSAAIAQLILKRLLAAAVLQ